MQKYIPNLDRANLSDDLAMVIREMIFNGRLSAGERVKEVALAEQLGVSRTPLREALAALVAEGALVSVPRQGVSVRELTVEEARDIYPIRAFLDPEALRLAGIPSPERLHRLEALNKKLRSAAGVAAAIRLDEDWHRELWADCPNQVLIDLIEQFIRRTRRYELASMSQKRNVRKTADTKRQILEVLREGRLSRACSMLRKSLMAGGTPVFEWLAARDSVDLGESA